MNIISRKEAIKQGLKTYFTGKACKRGHIALRQVANNNCYACVKIRVYKYSSIPKNKVKYRDSQLLKRYNISRDEYNKMIITQNNCCTICKNSFAATGLNTYNMGNSICVDHDHKTGETRSLLCNNCNRALGLFKDNTEIVLSAYKYLTLFEKERE